LCVVSTGLAAVDVEQRVSDGAGSDGRVRHARVRAVLGAPPRHHSAVLVTANYKFSFLAVNVQLVRRANL
jgi:hypothetical protein